MKRYTLYLTEEQIEALKKKSAETHILVSELIRLAIDASHRAKDTANLG